MPSPVIIAVTNQKGGIGKTTTAVHLATGIRRFTSKLVLVVDIGPQANTSSLFVGDEFVNQQEYADEPSIFEVLTDDQFPLLDAVYSVDLDENTSIDILPAKNNLNSARGIFPSLTRQEYRLSDAFYMSAQTGHPLHDYIIIDCPPSLDLFNLNAIVAATHILVPVAPGENNLKGMRELLDTIDRANGLKMRNRDKPLTVLGAVMTLMDRTALAKDSRNKILSETPFPILAEIPRLIAVQEAEAAHQDLFAFDPKSKATAAYKQLVKEVINGTK